MPINVINEHRSKLSTIFFRKNFAPSFPFCSVEWHRATHDLLYRMIWLLLLLSARLYVRSTLSTASHSLQWSRLSLFLSHALRPFSIRRTQFPLSLSLSHSLVSSLSNGRRVSDLFTRILSLSLIHLSSYLLSQSLSLTKSLTPSLSLSRSHFGSFLSWFSYLVGSVHK